MKNAVPPIGFSCFPCAQSSDSRAGVCPRCGVRQRRAAGQKNKIAAALFAVAFHGLVHAGVSAEAVQKQASRAVTFTVIPTENGELGECHVSAIRELDAPASSSAFRPSQAYVRAACEDALANAANWIPERDESGRVKPVDEVCMWSAAIPDIPICRLEVAARFAEELPLGVGYSAVFALASDTSGHITSCTLASLRELSRDAYPADIQPHALFVSDACRKLSSVTWSPASPGQQRPFFMYCRYTPQIPVRAFCGREFGQ